MSAIIPSQVAQTPLHDDLIKGGLTHSHQGKVRDTYTLQDDRLLVVATDRVSIFDLVLPFTIPRKGSLLTAITIFWLTEVLTDVDHHLVAYGKGIDKYLPKSLRGHDELHQRALIVRKLEMVPIECIIRGYLTGSGWNSYQRDQKVCGIQLPQGLHNGSRITPNPIFTPTTKAETGHDEHLFYKAVIRQHGAWIQDRSLAVYQKLSEVAEDKGLILADTKLEFGCSQGTEGILADEVGTPDSSRFWDQSEWMTAQERNEPPQPYDKEIIRHWGKQQGLDKIDPEDPDRVTFTPPRPVIIETFNRYSDVLERLTGYDLDGFHKAKFGIC